VSELAESDQAESIEAIEPDEEQAQHVEQEPDSMISEEQK